MAMGGRPGIHDYEVEQCGPKQDVWACGCLLYILLSASANWVLDGLLVHLLKRALLPVPSLSLRELGVLLKKREVMLQQCVLQPEGSNGVMTLLMRFAMAC